MISNRRILLIGGSGVLGKYFAEQLSKNNEVHVADIFLKNKKINKNLFTYKLDIGKESEVKNFFYNTNKKYGKFDTLVNNAAFTTEMAAKKSKNKKKDFFSTKVWDQTINVNLKGAFLTCKYFIKYNHEKKIDQRVINIGTIYALNSPHHEIYNNEKFFSSISYTASKAGLIGMTKWLASKYALEKTYFNCISPAGVFNNQTKSFLKNYTKLIPLKKMASQKQIYSAIEFLLSKDANYVVGQNIYVDGGFTAW
tara:strand:- start:29 stop:787 length:759 start_codon:yes stop_codon:yes gene_type:complete